MRPHPFRLAIILALLGLIALPGCRSRQSVRDHRSHQYLDSAKGYQAQGLNESALAAFTLALEMNPNLVEAYMGMGEIYRQQGNLEAASKSYEQATTLAPQSFEAHYYLGLVKQLMGQFQAAVTAYLHALTINPDSFEANQNVASAYLQLGRPSDAVTYAKRATELKHNSQSAWANLAAVYSMLGDYENAAHCYREAAQYGELAEPLVLGLADADIHLGHFDSAKAALDTLIHTHPSATAYERKGFVLFRQGKYDDALASFRLALEKDSNDVASLNGLGVCLITLYVESGRANVPQRDEGIEAWRRSLQLQPDQPRIVDLLSRYQHL